VHNELPIIKKISHPKIVCTHRVIDCGDSAMIVMEYCDENLLDWVKRKSASFQSSVTNLRRWGNLSLQRTKAPYPTALLNSPFSAPLTPGLSISGCLEWSSS
jgi:hypothetical protein